jgi:rhomboid protease GluP
VATCTQCGRKFPSLFSRGTCKWCRLHQAAQRGEIDDDARQAVMPVPWTRRSHTDPFVSKVLFGINAAVFLGMALAGVSIMNPAVNQLVDWGANYGPLTFGGQPWRLITAVFLHIGIIHLALNMWCLWSLGGLAESLYGSWTFSGIYLVCGLAGALASKVWAFGGVSAGASGAIFGIAGALLASIKLGEFPLPREHTGNIVSSLVTFMVYSMVFGFIQPGIDNANHIGGLVAGLILGALVAKIAPERGQWARRLAILLVVLAPVAAGAAWMQRSHAYYAHFDRANNLASEKKLDAAASEYQAALRSRPDYFPAHYNLAIVYFEQKNLPAAENELRRAVELDPRSAKARAFLAEVFRNENNCEYALGEYKNALSLQPRLQGVNYEMGLCYLQLGRSDDAIAALRTELNITGEDRDIELALADAYQRKGMSPEAEDARKKAAALPKTDDQ